MPIIRAISDLRNNFGEISELCHSEDEPVFITKNGQGDLVVMSLAHYNKLLATLELYEKIEEAEAESASGVPKKSHAHVMKRARERVHGKA